MATPSKLFGRSMLALMAAGFVALLLVGGMSLWLVLRTAAYQERVLHTADVKTEIYRTLTLAQDAETGQRGFLLTGNDDYLDRYRAALETLPTAIEAGRRLTADNPAQQANIERLALAWRAKLIELRATLDLAQAGRREEALAVVRSNRGREAMRAVRSSIADMIAEENRLERERSDELNQSGRWLLAVNLAGVLLIALLSGGVAAIGRRNFTVLQSSQDKLAELNASLEATVAERTADLTRANDEVQRFAYIVSHDLRAPLVNIMGFTSELDAARSAIAGQVDRIDAEAPHLVDPAARLAANEDLPEAIGFIRASTAKMDRLINAILNLSRDGKRVMTPEQVDISGLVEGIATSLHQQTEATGAEIAIEGNLPTLVTDKLAVEQIFSNLIENAVKYLDPNRPGRIVVKGRMNGSMVRYDIEDNGRGIDARDHERVFELFRRAGAQDRPGEGLGLTFVRSSVRRLGGSISMQSEPGRGSTFSLEFPKFLQRSKEAQAA